MGKLLAGSRELSIDDEGRTRIVSNSGAVSFLLKVFFISEHLLLYFNKLQFFKKIFCLQKYFRLNRIKKIDNLSIDGSSMSK